jgi:hypothetical protein
MFIVKADFVEDHLPHYWCSGNDKYWTIFRDQATPYNDYKEFESESMFINKIPYYKITYEYISFHEGHRLKLKENAI